MCINTHTYNIHGDITDPGIKPVTPALADGPFTIAPSGKRVCVCVHTYACACVCIQVGYIYDLLFPLTV